MSSELQASSNSPGERFLLWNTNMPLSSKSNTLSFSFSETPERSLLHSLHFFSAAASFLLLRLILSLRPMVPITDCCLGLKECGLKSERMNGVVASVGRNCCAKQCKSRATPKNVAAVERINLNSETKHKCARNTNALGMQMSTSTMSNANDRPSNSLDNCQCWRQAIDNVVATKQGESQQ